MKVVVDSGGSKADWAILIENQWQITTVPKDVQEKAGSIPDHIMKYTEEITEVNYYGAGLYNEEKCNQKVQELRKIFRKGELNCHSDLLAACRSTAMQQPGIIGILGTGSNSCTYNGEEITANIPALGYVIGDEGSGTAIGKAILKSYFYKEMKEGDRVAFHKQYGLDKSSLLAAMSDKTNAASYLASFAAFPNIVKSEDLFEVVKLELEQFFERRVLSYYQYSKYQIHFVGSIAYFYDTLIRELCDQYGLNLGLVAQKPINTLVQYHR